MGNSNYKSKPGKTFAQVSRAQMLRSAANTSQATLSSVRLAIYFYATAALLLPCRSEHWHTFKASTPPAARRQEKRAGQGRCIPKGVTPFQGDEGHRSSILLMASSDICTAAEHSTGSAGSLLPVTGVYASPALVLLHRPVSFCTQLLVTFVTDRQLQPSSSLLSGAYCFL